MFVARYFDRRRGESDTRGDHTNLAVKKHLEAWLPHRPTAEYLESRNILVRPNRYRDVANMLEEFLAVRLTNKGGLQAHSTGASGGKYTKLSCSSSAKAHIDTAFAVGNKSFSAASKECQNRMDVAKAELAKTEAELPTVRGSRLIEALGVAKEVKNAAQVAGGVYQRHKSARPETDQSVSILRQQLSNAQTLERKISYVEVVLKALRLTEEAQGFVVSEPCLALHSLAVAASSCFDLESSCRKLIASRSLSLLPQLKQHFLDELHFSLSAINWGVMGGDTNVREKPAVPSSADIASTREAIAAVICVQRLWVIADSFIKCVAAPSKPKTLVDGSSDRLLQQLYDLIKTASQACINVEDLWCFKALASWLITSFRYHFRRRQSPLCRLDKPDWALSYLLDVYVRHVQILQILWPSEPSPQSLGSSIVECEVALGLKSLNYARGLGVQLAREGQYYVRWVTAALFNPHPVESSLFEGTGEKLIPSSLLQLASGDDSKDLSSKIIGDHKRNSNSMDLSSKIVGDPKRSCNSLMLLLIHNLMEVHRSWRAIDVLSAHSLFEDFDRNTKLAEILKGSWSTESDSRREAISLHVEEAEARAEREYFEEESESERLGMLDYWVIQDRQLMHSRISRLAEGKAGLKQHRATLEGQPILCNMLASLLGQLIGKAAERMDCLSNDEAISYYAQNSMGPTLRTFRTELRAAWNAADVFDKEIATGCLLLNSVTYIQNVLGSPDLKCCHHLHQEIEAMTHLYERMSDHLLDSFATLIRAALKVVVQEHDAFEHVFAKLNRFAQGLVKDNAVKLETAVCHKVEKALEDYVSNRAAFRSRGAQGLYLHNCHIVLEKLNKIESPRRCRLQEIVAALDASEVEASRFLLRQSEEAPRLLDGIHFLFAHEGLAFL